MPRASALFDALVRPILEFGCEVWGPRCYAITSVAGEVEQLHMLFLRMCLGIKTSVARDIVYEELQRQPMAAAWVARAVGYAHRVWKREVSDLARRAMVESWEMAKRGVKNCWAASLEEAVKRCGGEGWSWEGNDLRPPRFSSQSRPEQQPAQLGAAQLSAAQHSAAERSTAQHSKTQRSTAHKQAAEQQRAGPGGGRQEVRAIADGDHDGFKTLTYRRWFSPGATEGGARSQFWQVLCSKEDVERVAKFRMGSHRLEVEEGRFRSVPRSHRVCKLCSSGMREDERHLVFECERYSDIRVRYSGLFESEPVVSEASVDRDINKWMNPVENQSARAFWPQFSCFLKECLRRREDYLNELG